MRCGAEGKQEEGKDMLLNEGTLSYVVWEISEEKSEFV